MPAGQPTAPSPHGSSLLLPSQHGSQNNRPPSDQRNEIILRICNLDRTIVVYYMSKQQSSIIACIYSKHSYSTYTLQSEDLHHLQGEEGSVVSGFRIRYFKYLIWDSAIALCCTEAEMRHRQAVRERLDQWHREICGTDSGTGPRCQFCALNVRQTLLSHCLHTLVWVKSSLKHMQWFCRQWF